MSRRATVQSGLAPMPNLLLQHRSKKGTILLAAMIQHSAGASPPDIYVPTFNLRKLIPDYLFGSSWLGARGKLMYIKIPGRGALQLAGNVVQPTGASCKTART